MNFGQRLFYYLGGFAIGLILLFFFLGGKKTSCNYGPNSRVLKNIRIKERILSAEFTQNLQKLELDTSAISTLLASGKVNFSKSNTELDSCKIYVIEGSVQEKELALLVANCDSVAIFNNLVYDSK